jgi:hypothetical protein
VSATAADVTDISLPLSRLETFGQGAEG